jgi:hypothetical protein
MIVAGRKLMFVKEVARFELPRLEGDLQMGMGPEVGQVNLNLEGWLYLEAE